MTLTNTTHLNFRGDARAALEFYRDVFGGELTILTFEDMHSVQNPDEATQVMWGGVTAPNGFRIMAFDVPSAREWDRGIQSFFESLRGQSMDEVTPVWEGLSDGATVLVPFGPAQWSAGYGMLTDKFGITWVIDVEAQPAS